MSEDANMSAVEVLQDALAKIKAERLAQAEWAEDLRTQLEIAICLHAEALVAEAAIEKLLGGDLYVNNPSWGAVDERYPLTNAAPPPPLAPVDLIDWTKVKAPWGDLQWSLALSHLRPEVPVAEETPAVAAMRAAIVRRPEPAPPTPPKALPAPPKVAQPRAAAQAPDGRPLAEYQMDRALAALTRLCAEKGLAQVSLSVLATESGIPTGSMVFNIRRLEDAGKITVEKPPNTGGARAPNIYRVVGLGPRPDAPAEPVDAPEPPAVASEPEPPLPALADPAAALLHVLKGIASPRGLATARAVDLCVAANIPLAQWAPAKGALIKSKAIKLFQGPSKDDGVWSFRIGPFDAPPEPAPDRFSVEAAKIVEPFRDPPPAPAVRPAAKAPVERPAGRALAPKIDDETFIPEELDRASTGPCTLMNLRRRDCHWPVGDARPQLYCGKPALNGEEYCEGHFALKFTTKAAMSRAMDDRAEGLRTQALRDRRQA